MSPNRTKLNQVKEAIQPVKDMLPLAEDTLNKCDAEIDRPYHVVAISDGTNAPRTGALFSESPAVSVIEIPAEYPMLVEAVGSIQETDSLVLETNERLTQDSIALWQVSCALSSEPALFIHQRESDSVSPGDAQDIAEANREDCKRIFTGAKQMHYLTSETDLEKAIYDARDERNRSTIQATYLTLDNMVRERRDHEQERLEFLHLQRDRRRRFENTFSELTFGADEAWYSQFNRNISATQAGLRDKADESIHKAFNPYNGGEVYNSLVALNRNSPIKPWKRHEIAALEGRVRHRLTADTVAVYDRVTNDFRADLNTALETEVDALFNMIAAEHVLDDAIFQEIKLETDTALAEKLPHISIDEKRALLSRFKRIRTIAKEILSGAFMGGVAGFYISREMVGVAIGAVVGATIFGVWGFFDARDTEKQNFSNLFEQHCAGLCRDAERAVRKQFSKGFSESIDAQVQQAIEDAVAFISVNLAQELEDFKFAISAPPEELRIEIERVEQSIKQLDALLILLNSEAADDDAPADSDSEAAAAD